MKLKVLSSSSKGNCYVLQSPTGSLFLEAGIPWREIQKGLDFNLSNIEAALISHNHKDHCKAVKEVMSAGIDCYMSHGTADALGLCEYRLCFMSSEIQFNIGDFTILPFETEHDCPEPLGFLIQYRPTNEKILFLTDSYYSKYRFKGLNYVMIEANYCKDILDRNIEAGLIDEGMKRRLLESHMSLENCKNFLSANDLSQVREIILLHLSEGNSSKTRMQQEIFKQTGTMPKIAEAGFEVDLELYPY
jgi:phosphoribosyl 1,2-cyclic phosphodiesterase